MTNQEVLMMALGERQKEYEARRYGPFILYYSLDLEDQIDSQYAECRIIPPREGCSKETQEGYDRSVRAVEETTLRMRLLSVGAIQDVRPDIYKQGTQRVRYVQLALERES